MSKNNYYDEEIFFDKPRIKKMKLKDADENVYPKKLKKHVRRNLY